MLDLLSRLRIGRDYFVAPMGERQKVGRQWGVSRSTVYEIVRGLEDPRRLRKLRAQNRQLQEGLQRTQQELRQRERELRQFRERLMGEENRVEELVVQAAVCPVSCGKIAQLLKRAYGVERSTTWVWGVVKKWGEWARRVFEYLKPWQKAEVMAVDEIFQGKKPTLVMVEPESFAICRIQVEADRSAETWKKLLEDCRALREVVADRAKGIECAVNQVGKLKQDDLFHALKVISDVFRRWEASCYREIAQEYRLGEKLKGQERPEVRQRYLKQKAEVDKRLKEFDEAEGILRLVHEVLQVTDWTGQWVNVDTREELLREAMSRWKRLEMPQQQRVRGYLLSPNLLTFARQIQQTLELAEIQIPGLPRESFGQAVVRAWSRGQKSLRGDSPTQRLGDLLILRAAQQSSPDFQDAVEMIHQELSKTIRASSSVEAVNSLLRPVQQIKKTFPTDFAYLLALYHNMRPFSEGPRKGKTPFEILGIPLMFKDWIELIRRVA